MSRVPWPGAVSDHAGRVKGYEPRVQHWLSESRGKMNGQYQQLLEDRVFRVSLEAGRTVLSQDRREATEREAGTSLRSIW